MFSCLQSSHSGSSRYWWVQLFELPEQHNPLLHNKLRSPSKFGRVSSIQRVSFVPLSPLLPSWATRRRSHHHRLKQLTHQLLVPDSVLTLVISCRCYTTLEPYVHRLFPQTQGTITIRRSFVLGLEHVRCSRRCVTSEQCNSNEYLIGRVFKLHP